MEKRLIDANALKRYIPTRMDMQDLYLPVHFKTLIDEQPTVDAVPVVRCKDCKHLLVINGNELYATCRKSVMQFDSFGVDTREFYCAYGEVKHE